MTKRIQAELGFIMKIIFIGLVSLIIAIVVMLNNIFNFSTIYNFGLGQYTSNVVNLHEDSYVKSKVNLKVYKSVVEIDDLETTRDYILLPKGANFELKGSINERYVTWIAVKFFNKNNKVYGYIFINDATTLSVLEEEKNNYYHIISEEKIDNFKNKQFRTYKNKLMDTYKIKVALTAKVKQKMEENKKFQFLFSIKNKNYYGLISDKLELDNLYEMYYGTNYETIFLNSSKKYNPSEDGAYSENTIPYLLESRLFNVFLIIVFIITILYFLKGSNQEKCPKCGSKDIHTSDAIVIAENYEYENKNGKPDKRRTDNKIIQTVEINERCNNCKKEWYYEATRDK